MSHTTWDARLRVSQSLEKNTLYPNNNKKAIVRDAYDVGLGNESFVLRQIISVNDLIKLSLMNQTQWLNNQFTKPV